MDLTHVLALSPMVAAVDVESGHPVLINLNCAAVIVVFYPDPTQLAALLQSVRQQVDRVYVMNNGASDETLAWLRGKDVRLIDMSGNQGIAAALNAAARCARQDGIDFLLTFDQDSIAAPQQAAVLHQCWAEKTRQGIRVGGVGPGFFDERGGQPLNYPFHRARGWRIEKIFHPAAAESAAVETDILITSGMLVTVDAVLAHPFCEALFIDFVDIEWCFRTRKHGWQHFGCFGVRMQHELSEAAPRKIAGLTLLRYSPLRRYYFFRNGLHVLVQPWTPTAFRLRIGAGLLTRLATLWLTDASPAASLRMALKGVCDVLRGRMGRLD